MKTDLPYVWAPAGRSRVYTYYRRGRHRQRIEGEFRVVGGVLKPSAEWRRNYDRIHKSFEQGETAIADGTLRAVIARYRASPDYMQRAPKTRREYGVYLDLLAREYGDLPVASMPRAFVFELRDKHAATPRKADYIIQVLRRVLSFAVDRGYLTINPAARPKRLYKAVGHEPWEEEQVDAFRARWPLGTMERTAFELLLNTGQRSGDVVAMGRAHVQGEMVRVRQQKTGERVEIPVSDDLRAALAAWQSEHVVLFVGRDSKAMGIDRFRHRMAAAYKAAGLAGVTTHGLRYTAATRLRELGQDWTEIEAITGHATVEMVKKYAGRRRKASLSIHRLNQAARRRGVSRGVNRADGDGAK